MYLIENRRNKRKNNMGQAWENGIVSKVSENPN